MPWRAWPRSDPPNHATSFHPICTVSCRATAVPARVTRSSQRRARKRNLPFSTCSAAAPPGYPRRTQPTPPSNTLDLACPTPIDRPGRRRGYHPLPAAPAQKAVACPALVPRYRLHRVALRSGSERACYPGECGPTLGSGPCFWAASGPADFPNSRCPRPPLPAVKRGPPRHGASCPAGRPRCLVVRDVGKDAGLGRVAEGHSRAGSCRTEEGSFTARWGVEMSGSNHSEKHRYLLFLYLYTPACLSGGVRAVLV